MTTTFLYRAFGLRGYGYRSQTFESGGLIVTIGQPRADLRCTACRSADVERRGSRCREWQTVLIGSRPVYLRMHVPRLHCWNCGVTRQPAVTFAEPYKQHTRCFGLYVLELRRCMTIKDVAAHLSVSEWLVRDIEQRHLGRHFAKPRLKHLTQIAIDEISIGKGHRYVTVVLDLDSGAIVHVGDGKGGDALAAFAGQPGQHRGRSDGPLAGLRGGCPRASAGCGARVRPVSSGQAAQRGALGVAA